MQLKFFGRSRYMGAYVGIREELEAQERTEVEA